MIGFDIKRICIKLPFRVYSISAISGNPFLHTLHQNSKGILELIPTTRLGKMTPFHIDFQEILNKRGLKSATLRSELICKAIGNQALVIDMTAGLGRDAVLVAASGNVKYVHMLEENSVLLSLLRDALRRFAIENPQVSNRLSLMQADSTNYDEIINSFSPQMQDLLSKLQLHTTTELSDGIAVYIDPMYPPDTTGRKAMVKKESQILRCIIEGATTKSTTSVPGVVDDGGGLDTSTPADIMHGVNDLNTVNLFNMAWKLATTRVVVKRPLNSHPVGFHVPHQVMKGSRQRFDIYHKNRALQMSSIENARKNAI